MKPFLIRYFWREKFEKRNQQNHEFLAIPQSQSLAKATEKTVVQNL